MTTERKYKHMKMLKVNLALIIAFLVFSCSNKPVSDLDLNSDINLKAIFSNIEIQEIKRMIDYVDQRVVRITKNDNVELAYHQFLDMYRESMYNNARIVPFVEEEKYQFLKTINNDIFNAFFKWDTFSDRIKYRDTTLLDVDYLTSLMLNAEGAYMEYVKACGETDIIHSDLYEVITAMGGMPAGLRLPLMHNKLDFTEVKNRLFASVYILKIEDASDVKLDRYFNKIPSK